MSQFLLGSRALAGSLIILLLLSNNSKVLAQMPFFPGAEGYGGSWSGTAPAGGWLSNASVYHVTNLNDDGPGSFRNAFDENSANKIIVFDVAGTIELTSGKLDIKNLANYYIAGQTAPGPVTIYGDMTQLTHSSNKENRNVVLRYLSFRKGTAGNSDSVTFAGSGLGTNLILDHVSASWSEDEVLSVANNNTNVTVQYSTIHDALVNNHAYGSLIRPRISSDVTFHHNLYANNASRQARFGTYNGELLTADFRNNVVYNFRDRASYTGGSSEADQEQTDVNYVGNYIIAGPGTTGNPDIAYWIDKNVDTRVYQSGNLIDPDEAPGGAAADGVLDGTDTGWSAFAFGSGTDQTLTQMASPFGTPAVTTQTATDAYSQVVDYVGNWWWNRDTIDSRVIGNVTNFTGVPIGAAGPIASELSGLLSAPQVNHPVGWDTDGDGMPTAWETDHGGNLVWNGDFDNDGYINLIEYINEAGEFPAPAPIDYVGPTSGGSARYALIENWMTNDGGVTSGTNWQPSKYDLARITSGTIAVDAVGQHAGTLQVAPNAGNNATLDVTSGWIKVDDDLEIGSASGTGVLAIASGATVYADNTMVKALGLVQGNGTLSGNLYNAGEVAPGTSVGMLTVDGDFQQDGAGLITMELDSAASFDQLDISGMFLAAGTLDIDLNYSPTLGDTFDLFDFSGALGSMLVNLPALSPGLTWETSALLTTGELSVISAPPAGNADFDGSGIIDGFDFLLWQQDPNVGNLADWELSYGSSVIVATATTIPEPGTAVLALIAISCAIRSRRVN